MSMLLLLLVLGLVSARIHQDFPAESWAKYEIYFGLSIQEANGTNTPITISEFQAFLDSEVTPRFPDGLSWTQLNGQYSGSAGLIYEGSVQVIIYAPFLRTTSVLVSEISAAYVTQFRQESVLVGIIPTTLVCFEGNSGLCLGTWSSGFLLVPSLVAMFSSLLFLL